MFYESLPTIILLVHIRRKEGSENLTLTGDDEFKIDAGYSESPTTTTTNKCL